MAEFIGLCVDTVEYQRTCSGKIIRVFYQTISKLHQPVAFLATLTACQEQEDYSPKGCFHGYRRTDYCIFYDAKVGRFVETTNRLIFIYIELLFFYCDDSVER